MGSIFNKSVLLLIGMICFSVVNAQQVTFEELLNSKAVSDSKKSSTKKWIQDFNALEDIDAAKEILVAEFLKLENTKHWISLNTPGVDSKELSYQTSKTMYVSKMVGELKEAGFTLASHKIEEGSKTFVYSKENLKVEIIALSTETATETAYLVTLLR